MESERGQISALLHRVRAGDRQAESDLLDAVYQNLHAIAARQMRREALGHTLQPTALVGELYMKLQGQPIDWQDRTHFFVVAAMKVRRILLDHARKKSGQKAPPRNGRVDLEKVCLESNDRPDAMVMVDQALNRLAEHNPRQARVVEMRIFGGLQFEDIAGELGVAVRTVKRDWVWARALLSKQLNSGDGAAGAPA
jgi:RNA polymerase sigma factor (TIGR02999 family)